MEIEEFVDISQHTTFRMGPTARYFAVAKNMEDLKYGCNFAKSKNLFLFILGSGSNIIFSQSDVFDAVVLKLELPGFEVAEENENDAIIKIGAGEIWDNVVKRSVEMGLWGIEAMSWIPGTAGATPIQNVGAYGTEIADVLISLEAYEVATGEMREFSREQCKFSYRDSLFKQKAKDKYIIASITIRLSKEPGVAPDYPGVKKYFEEKGISNPTLSQIRQAIIDIRNVKLPDPKEIASVGSFFKNPFIDESQYEKLKQVYPNIIAFPIEGGGYKIGAGWMLETLGLKGQQFGKLQFYFNNALVMTNRGGATFPELESVVNDTKMKVKEAFGIELEVEPTII